MLSTLAAWAAGGCGDGGGPLAPVITDEPPALMTTWAGTGNAAWGDDGLPLLQSTFYWPADLTITPQGDVYILDWNNHRVRVLEPDGTLKTVIGGQFVGDGPGGTAEFSPPGVPGETVLLNHPTNIIPLPDGRMLLTAWHNHKLRIYDPATGLVEIICGDRAGYSGDGGPAELAQLNQPSYTVVAPNGSFFILDQRNQCVRMIEPQPGMPLRYGIITTVVGTGVAGFSGDGGAPLDAQLQLPAGSNPPPAGGLVLDSHGRLYISDTLNHRVRRVDFMLNLIETVAGNGEAGFNGDGIATSSSLNNPRDLEIGPDGRLYIADQFNNRVRAVDLQTGVMTTVAGTGEAAHTADYGIATEMALNEPVGLEFDAEGNLYIADQLNNRIRKVEFSPSPESISPPAAPTELSGKALSNTEILLSWTDASSNEDGFHVYRRLDSDSVDVMIATVAADSASFLDSGLAQSTTYHYRVESFNRIGPSETAASVSVTTNVEPPPAGPTNLQCTALSDSIIQLNWTDSSEDEDGFHLYRGASADAIDELIATLDAGVESFDDEGLLELTTYHYRLYSFNDGGESKSSVSDSATTYSREGGPVSPSGLKGVAVSSAAIQLSWTDESEDEDGFRIYRGLTSNAVSRLVGTVPAGVTSFEDMGLVDLTTYYYRVFAYNEEGNSRTYTAASVTTLALPAPAAPTGLVCTAESSSRIALNWADASDTEEGFRVYRGLTESVVDELVAELPAGTQSHVDTGLDDSTRYYYRVRSFNRGGESEAFASDFATTFLLVPYSVIETFMGTGAAGLGMDGLPPEETQLYLPMDIEFGPDDRPYVVDWNNHRIRTVDNGIVVTYIGTGELGDAPEGPARDASLNHPTHVSFGPDGFLYLAAWHNSKVMRVDPATQMLELICGNGQRNYGGDGGPAIDAIVDLPSATAVDAMGRVYVSDQANQRVRRIGTNGIINTIAGTGVAGYSGDGGPATQAQLRFPGSPQDQSAPPAARIALDPAGNLYIADTFNHRIRKVNLAGTITTVAGAGLGGYLGDNGPATAAWLKEPNDVAIDVDGNLFIADTRNHIIRMVDSAGIITTIAGTPQAAGSSGDGGDPKQARLNRPWGICFDANRNLYIADTLNNKIRVVYYEPPR